MSEYSQSSITSLKGPDTVRKRPAVIFGTNDSEGAAHGIWEIIANSIDEAKEGFKSKNNGGKLFGDHIKVSAWNDGTVEVTDNGRGVPMDWNEVEGKYNWELVFCTLYASGKYDSANYGSAVGLNGLGATAMQYASSFMDVWSTRDGKTYHMRFEKGVPVTKLEITEPIREDTGTTIKFLPDSDVFIEMAPMSFDYYVDLLRRQAMLVPGLEIIFWHEDVGADTKIYFPNGIKDFVGLICKRPMSKNVMYSEGTASGADREGEEAYNLKMRCAICFSRESQFLEIYHNNSLMFEGGVTLDATKTGIVSAIYVYGRQIGKFKDSDKLQFRDIEPILVCVADTSAPGHRTYFKNQTKGAINNPFIKSKLLEFVEYALYQWMTQNKSDAEIIVDEVIKNKIAREEAEKVSKKVLNSLKQKVTSRNAPEKFVDCTSKNPSERELYIVEGDSARGSCILSRDARFQAIMPVRGKIMNCLKQDLTKILNSDIIRDLLRLFKCGIEAKSKYLEGLPEFDLDKLDYSKIIICTDADVDGMHIRCLILTMIYRLCPTLLRANRVYIAETPLFEINWGRSKKNNTRFAYSDSERDTIISELVASGVSEKSIKISRSKGLGENDKEMMHISTMNPDTRKLTLVECPDPRSPVINTVFEGLMGDDLETRRNVIMQYFDMLEEEITQGDSLSTVE